MKKLTYIAVLVLLAACSQPKSAHLRIIEEYIKSEIPGVKPSYIVEVLESEETGVVTAADSTAILRAAFDEAMGREINYAKARLSSMETLAAKVTRPSAQTADALATVRAQIDSLQRIEFTDNPYAAVPGDKVLARTYRTWFRITDPAKGSAYTLEDTYTFVLSPDGKKCLAHYKAK